MDKHCITLYIFFTPYISVDLGHHEIFSAKVGKGGIIDNVEFSSWISSEVKNVCHAPFMKCTFFSSSKK